MRHRRHRAPCAIQTATRSRAHSTRSPSLSATCHCDFSSAFCHTPIPPLRFYLLSSFLSRSALLSLCCCCLHGCRCSADQRLQRQHAIRGGLKRRTIRLFAIPPTDNETNQHERNDTHQQTKERHSNNSNTQNCSIGRCACRLLLWCVGCVWRVWMDGFLIDPGEFESS